MASSDLDPELEALIARSREIVSSMEHLARLADTAIQESLRLHAEHLELNAAIERRQTLSYNIAPAVGVLACAVCRRGIARVTDLVIGDPGTMHTNCAAWARAS